MTWYAAKKKYNASSANQEDLKYHLMHVKILINISTETYFSKNINKYLTELCVREVWSFRYWPWEASGSCSVGGVLTWFGHFWHLCLAFLWRFSPPCYTYKDSEGDRGMMKHRTPNTHTHTSSYLSLSLCQLSPQPFSVTLVSSCLPLSVFCSVLKKAQGRSIKVWMTWKLWSQCEHTHKHGHSLENNMVCIHTCTESTLCISVGSAGFVDSICSAPRHLPFAPHPLWQVEGIQTQKLRRHTLNSTDTWLVFRLHTHTHIYTPAVVQSYSAPWCQAGWAVRRVFIPPALRPNRGWGIRPDSPQKNSNIQ